MRRSQGIHRACRLCVAVVLLAAGASHAQLLDLPDARPAPTLESPTAAEQIIAELRAEIDAIADRERGAPESVRVILRSLINMRILAAELLEAGDRAGHEGSIAIVMGLTIATEREGMDRLLLGELAPNLREPPGDENEEKDDGGGADADEAGAPPAERIVLSADMIAALHAFNERVVDHADLVRTADPGELDEALSFLLAPLAEAIEERAERPIVSHWPALDGLGAAGEDGADALIPGDADLSDAVRGLVRDEAARETAVMIAERIEQGLEIPAYRLEARLLRARLSRLVGVMRAIDEAAPAANLSSDMHARLTEVFRNGLDALADPRRRSAAEDWTSYLESSGALARRIKQLAQGRHDVRPIVAAYERLEAEAWSGRSINADGAADAIDATQPGAGASNSDGDSQDVVAPPPSTAHLDRMRHAADPLIQLAEFDRAAVPRWLRPSAQRMEREARIAARRFNDAMASIHSAAAFTSDPGVVAALDELARYAQALRWMQEAEAWRAALLQFAPDRDDRFRNQLRQWFDDLLDVGRAQRAMDHLRRLDREVDRFAVLPFEDALRERSPGAIELTGGVNDELASLVQRLRRQWAEAWSTGKPDDEATQNVDLAHRLLGYLEGSEALLAMREADARPVLQRWSAWAMPDAAMRRMIGDVPSRLKLACGAAVRGRGALLQRQLDQMERQAPIAWLIARMSLAMEDELAALPDGAPGLLGQLMHSPSDDAWMSDRRMEIAHICRYVIEAEFAGRTDRGGIEGEVNQYLSGLAEDLLRRIDEQRR